MNRINRLVSLMLVLQQRRTTPVAMLARRFGVTPRTVYRDLAALGAAGFPLARLEAGYGVPEGFRLPPLAFTPREATALLLGAEFVRARTDPTLKTAAEAAIAKIEGTLPVSVRSYARNMTAFVQLRHTARSGERHQREHLFTLQKAIADRRAVRIRYDRGSKGEISERVVEPLGMVFSADHWYVVAYCRSRRDIRVFRADRILRIEVLEEFFVPPAGFSLDTYLREDDEGQQDELLVELKVSPALAQRLRERMPFRVAMERKVGQCVAMTVRTFGLDHATRLILSMGSEAEVMGPPDVRGSVIQEAETLRSFYSKNGSGWTKRSS